MAILFDPEKSEIKALVDLYDDWRGKSVQEIGSGDGRLTWRYAERAERMVAIELGEETHADSFAELE